MDAYRIATQALDAAIEVDRASRGIEADLSGLAAVADALDAAWGDADPIVVMDFLDLIPRDVPRPATVPELGAIVAAMTARLRGAAAEDADGLAFAMRQCLHLHGELLGKAQRDWRPYGLAA